MRRGLTAAITVLALLFGCADRSERPRVMLPTDRLALPQIDPAGYEALLGELRGTPVVVNFWGSWCGPCIEEAPDLAAVAREYEGRVQFLGVDILDAREPARDFIRRFDWPYPSVFDPTGAVRDALGYVGQPITLVYDSRGELSFERTGAIDAEDLRREIREVL
jgi:cytochrome c biogenesis protein CcmG, thiol:disulfide interchange protein DsbE